ncbi:hypothetical protein N431DRAFT_234344 [Stipitochalara longipes BDJ]|nr:hypothetical protein N431DRAFT_234344 [Stipitochalara longipes BDJ]
MVSSRCMKKMQFSSERMIQSHFENPERYLMKKGNPLTVHYPSAQRNHQLSSRASAKFPPKQKRSQAKQRCNASIEQDGIRNFQSMPHLSISSTSFTSSSSGSALAAPTSASSISTSAMSTSPSASGSDSSLLAFLLLPLPLAGVLGPPAEAFLGVVVFLTPFLAADFGVAVPFLTVGFLGVLGVFSSSSTSSLSSAFFVVLAAFLAGAFFFGESSPAASAPSSASGVAASSAAAEDEPAAARFCCFLSFSKRFFRADLAFLAWLIEIKSAMSL